MSVLRLVTAAALTIPASAFANLVFVNFDNFNYQGSVTRYATLADAQNGTNAIGSAAITTATNGPRSTLTDARDATLYVDSGAPDAYYTGDYAQFGTAWYFTTFPANGDGWGNPNNTCNGFAQYVDDGSGGLDAAVQGGWSSNLKKFSMTMSGGSGDSFNAARAWAGGGGCGDGGTFHQFDLSLTADFAAAATLNGGTGLYEIDADPTAVAGGLQAIFQNDSASAPANNGYYVLSLTFHNGSWAGGNGATWNSGEYGPEAFFASDVVAAVPEPIGILLAGTALLAAGSVRRRRG